MLRARFFSIALSELRAHLGRFEASANSRATAFASSYRQPSSDDYSQSINGFSTVRASPGNSITATDTILLDSALRVTSRRTVESFPL
jgi:hypothetical protein